MPDLGIKKVTILKSDIEAIAGASQSYILRYRIVSEDKNRTSHWSPQYTLTLPNVTSIQHSLTVVGSTITCVWEHAQGQSTDKYDVYVYWETLPGDGIEDSWEYISTVSSPSFATIKRSNAISVKIAVQAPTFPKKRFVGSTLFESDEYAV